MIGARYRAFAGDVYEVAHIGPPHDDGSRDLDVVIPGTSRRLHLTRCVMDSDGFFRKGTVDANDSSRETQE